MANALRKSDDIPAIEGGSPTRHDLLPYSRQQVVPADLTAVTKVLSQDFLTSGPEVEAFEREFAEKTASRYALAVSSGTAALHCAYAAIGLQAGDEIIIPSLTFSATANAAVYLGARPVIADVDPASLLLSLSSIERLITPMTKAIVAVDYAGQPCDYRALKDLCQKRGVVLIADACHSLGGSYRDQKVGSLADVSIFSFHPTKVITTGEGGMLTTNDPKIAERARVFRNHGVTKDARAREKAETWEYDIEALGFNYRLSEVPAALGRSQLKSLDQRIQKRRELASQYDSRIAGNEYLSVLSSAPDRIHAYHLYVVRLELSKLRVDRQQIFRALRREGIGINVHYIPVHLLTYYRQALGYGAGLCPNAEAQYERILSLPLFPEMSLDDIESVVSALKKVLTWYSR